VVSPAGNLAGFAGNAGKAIHSPVVSAFPCDALHRYLLPVPAWL